MATRVRTVDLLPEIFRTETNKKFLAATLDQMVQPPKLKRVQGYIGKRYGIGVDQTDKYVIEPDKERADYQLEPTVVYKTADTQKTKDLLTYPGLIDALDVNDAITNRHDRLFSSDYYSWDPLVDYDKFVNFGQYYWLSSGPDPVDVQATPVAFTDDFTVTRASKGYELSGVSGTNPTLTLARGGNYTFNVTQTGNPFWIQSNAGTSGVIPGQENVSSREVFGVTNNGDDNGTVTFNAPLADAQSFYYGLTDLGTVDLATSLKFDEINNQFVDVFLASTDGIDQIRDLNGRTVIFLNRNTQSDPANSGWRYTDRFDTDGVNFDTATFDTETEITNQDLRYSVWQIQYVTDVSSTRPYMKLIRVLDAPKLNKIEVEYGTVSASRSYYRNAEGFWELIPPLTAVKDTLYYQDGTDSTKFGVIKLVDETTKDLLFVTDDIVGKKTYTAPNGVVFSNGMKVKFRGSTQPATYQDGEYYIEGVGNAIQLLPTSDYRTPEKYTKSETQPFDIYGYDSVPFDESLNAPTELDYFTINKASPDRNAWSRSNRWTHIDVINKTAEYNKTTALLNQDKRAKRPILEFKAGLRLFDYGTNSLGPVNIMDSSETDALSNVNGKTGYSVDGYSLATGTRIIFTKDTDPEVRNKIYQVELIDEDGSNATARIINLTKVNDVVTDDVVYQLSGAKGQGKTWRYDGTAWQETQQKTSINQAPLFDVFDKNGRGFSDRTYYPSTNFTGSKLFSYAPGSGAVDKELGIRLKYQTINNVGDIVFDNNLEKDTFIYTSDSVSTTLKVNTGFVRNYSGRTTFTREIGWKKHVNKSTQYQSLEFTYTGVPLVADIPARETEDIPVVVYVDNVFQETSRYSYTVSTTQTTITFGSGYAPKKGANITIRIQSDKVSQFGHYEVPPNLANNAPNGSFTDITLGTVRNHYIDLAQNLIDLSGKVFGANNSRDLGDIVPYGGLIVQQGSPLHLAATFIKDSNINFFNALDYSSREYEKYKGKLLDALAKNAFQGTVAEQLDEALSFVNNGRQNSDPFYWSDMIPCGQVFTETKYNITAIDDNIFDLSQTYDFTKANYLGLVVHVNDIQLIKDTDFTVTTGAPRLTISTTLNTGDVVKIREYTNTAGSFIPSTPTKLGLYNKYRPEKITDNSYVESQDVIIGHDGSKTIAFGDNRDDILLEFEKRIFNNIKWTGDVPLCLEDVAPGKFRKTDYANAEVTTLLNRDFLSWVAWNRLDYKLQDYVADNKKTWNYAQSQDRIDGELLPGNQRGIYLKYYDTDTPHVTPWEMIGFAVKPIWWNVKYGAAPYTSGNKVLWDDLENGRVWNGVDTYTVVAKWKRPGLSKIIPVDDEGNLKTAFDSIVGNYDSLSFEKSWVSGDSGPVETAWRRSSSFPFAVIRMLAQSKPAEFFALNADRDLYKYDSELAQYVYDGRSRIRAEDIVLYGAGTAKHSYINWCVEYSKKQGVSAIAGIKDVLENINIQLTYRLASFSDKEYLKIYTEKSSPNSNNASLLLPDESFEVFLYSNEVFDTAEYSSVIIQKTADGWAVSGNSQLDPYFKIYNSIVNGNYQMIKVGSRSVRVSKDFNTTTTRVPYGYVFTSTSAAADFLISYGRYLEDKGFVFEDLDNHYLLDWSQMIREFLHWSQQGWADGSIINLNPNANRLKITRAQSIVAPITGETADDFVLNQNLKAIPNNKLNFNRMDNTFEVESLDEDAISYLKADFTSYEHVLVFDNKSIFNDLLYDPTTGSRQQRLRISGYKTGEWNGQVDAQGFIFNIDNVKEWTNNKEYSKGDIVLFKNGYYTAAKSVYPKEKFDYSDWVETEYNTVKKGLLPNLSLKTDQLRDYYDINVANLEKDGDKLGFNIIGFNERDYLSSMGLDDISQINVFRSFIGSKGTNRAANLFKTSRLQKEIADYDIYENWAVKQGQYGAEGNRAYVELRLDESLMDANPSTFKITNSGSDQTVDQSVSLENLYKQSYKISTTPILPQRYSVASELNLPTAGYVNVDDINIQLFDILDLKALIPYMNKIGEGTTIWVAKDNRWGWNVYRSSLVLPTLSKITDNLDGTSTLLFDSSHGLAKDDIIMIKWGTDEGTLVDGGFRVLVAQSLNKISIGVSLPDDITSVTLEALTYKLNSVRVAQGSDILGLPFANEIDPGNRVWIDNNGNDRWQVLEKIDPFKQESSLEPSRNFINGLTDQTMVNIDFGASVAQNAESLTAFVGAPSYNSSKGGLFTYVKTANDTMAQNIILTGTGTTALDNYGNDVACANEMWSIAGASTSNSGEGYAYILKQLNSNLISEHQLLVNPSDANDEAKFGHAVAMSDDGRWAYVSAPGKDSVYVFQRVDRQLQRFTGTGNDDSNAQYDLSDYIIANEPDQIAVVVNNVELGVADYTFTSSVSSTGILTLNTGLTLDDKIAVTRRETLTLNGDGSTRVFDITGLYTADGEYSLTVTVNGVLQRLNIDYDYAHDSSNVFAFATAPADGAVIQVRSSDYYEYVTAIVGTKGEEFGYSLATTTDGRQVAIGARTANKTYIYDRDVERQVVTDATDKTYVSDKTPIGRAVVSVNGKILQDSARYIGGTYTVAGKTVTMATAPGLGDFVEIETNNFMLVDTMEMTNPYAGAEFGHKVTICPTNCSVYVSAPEDGTVLPSAGSVQRSVNQSRFYGTITGTVSNPTVTIGEKIRINNVVVTFTGTTLDQVVTDINNATIPNVKAVNSNGKLTISLTNIKAGAVANKLYVYPAGNDNGALTDLGLDIFKYLQTITSPYPSDKARFGESLSVSDDAFTVVVSSSKGASNLPTTFDNKKTKLDGGSTRIRDVRIQSGSVYTFDYLSSASDSISNPGKLVFGQQVVDNTVIELAEFGKAVDYKGGRLFITSPGHVSGDGSSEVGRVVIYNNAKKEFAWKTIREEGQVVNVELLNRAFIYDKNTLESKVDVDFFDPLQGKLLGAVRENIDYLTPVDPAGYDVGSVNNYGQTWRDEHVGEIWWNTTNTRYINHYIGDPEYRAKRWGQLFTGSSVDVYQWIESTQAPADYTGTGTVYSTTSYATKTRVGVTGFVETVYYYWVKNIPSVSPGKTLSPSVMAQYIEDPRASGIAYLAPVDANTGALYNVGQYLSAKDSILHVEYDRKQTDNNVHVEYELIKVGDPDQFLNAQLYRKLLDSFAGVDTAGNKVPDATLSEANQYGIEFRPRQSMFKDRYTALKNYLTRANRKLALYPISESKSFNLLNSKDNEPAATAYNKRLLTYEELTYQDLSLVSAGYKYLVANDSTQNNLWTMYEVQSNKTLLLTRVQNYKTSNYWSYKDWYATGYSANSKPTYEVSTYSRLSTVNSKTAVGEIVKVTTNSAGKFELYEKTTTGWVRIGLQDGTIEINKDVYDYTEGRNGFDVEVFDAQYFDEEPVTETRQIIKAINEELFIAELAKERIDLINLIFEYTKSEHTAADWLVKTSLIDVNHNLRDLKPFNIYQVDNQDFIEKYINEIKPYHVQVKEFSLTYKGDDLFSGDATDFDLPAYYDETQARFISPKLATTGVAGDFTSTDAIWKTWPYNQWISNYTLSIDSVTVLKKGSGYTEAPTVTVSGTATTPATMVARVNTAGEVISIEVTNPGIGYITAPTITLSGGNGTGAAAVAVTSPGTVRDMKTTLRYDRYEYQSEIVDWAANTAYDPGQLVRYRDKVYKAKNEDDSALSVTGATFNTDDFEVVDPGTLSGVNRTMGLYAPKVNNTGLDLGLLVSGTDYPGVQVKGVLYNQNTGYDSGNYDINPYDNLDFGEEGRPSYSESLLDTKYNPGDYTDTYLGTLTADINVDGGEYIDTYSSHSPEELVPSSIFDTLNMKVFTRPGYDYENDGHGQPFGSYTWKYTGSSDTTTVSWDLIENPFAVRVFNVTTGLTLRFEYFAPYEGTVNYSANWLNKTVTLTGSGVSVGDILRVESYGIGGGDQLWVDNYSVSDLLIDDSTDGLYVDIPVAFEDIYEAMIKVNGYRVTNYTFAELNETTTRVTFGTQDVDGNGTPDLEVKYDNRDPLAAGDYIGMAVFGYDENEKSTIPGYVTHDEHLVHSSSHPTSQIMYGNGTRKEFSLINDIQGTNAFTAVVEIDGRRLVPAEGIEYTGDGSSEGPFYLNLTNWSVTEDLFQTVIADSDVHCFVDGVEQKLYEDFTVSAVDASTVRYVVFTTAPAAGADVKIFVETSAEYKINYSGVPVSPGLNSITFNTAPIDGARIMVTTDNNTSELDIINRCYRGPTSTGSTITTGFDQVGFDADGEPFDKTVGIVVDTSNFDLGRSITKPDKLRVTVNGLRKYLGRDWQMNSTDSTELQFTSTAISDSDVVVVTLQTENEAPDNLNFAIFKDMRDNNAVYRIKASEQTTLTQALSATADTIYVRDASKLAKPNLNEGTFGIVIIDGERITYRNRDVTNNTLSGLRRGTAGTGAAAHAAGSIAYDYSVSTYLDYGYNKTWYDLPTVDDGSTVTQGKALQNTNTVPAKFLKGENS